ncbi:MAG: fold metallo-hydrolase [Chitinophagaceae bacterium]|nr:fold metallo-hydrolase [Chitinophagaceae bacterium]
MRIIPLSEGVFTIDKTKVFVPFDLSEDELQQRPVGSLLVEVQPFVVITGKDILLLDTGLGFSTKRELQLFTNLKAKGIDPASVTKVLLSHLHKDHAGGISVKDTLGNFSLSFPGATYYVHEKELAFAFDKGFPSYMIEELSILENNSNVVWLKDKGTIDGYIDNEVTAGHSPYHQVFWIHEDNETIFFGADDAPQLQQMKNKFVAKYDHDGKKCMQLRQQWWEQGRKEGWTFLFYHDVKTPTFKNIEQGIMNKE